MNFEIEQMAIVSISHLPETEVETLQNASENELPAFFDKFCVVVWTGAHYADDITHHAKPILQAAVDEGIDWVKFDRDGPILDEFPTFDW